MTYQPLRGIRITDLTAFWSGPSVTAFLAGMGAEVIKVESIQRPDPMRFSGMLPQPHWHEMGGTYLLANCGKLDVTLDLTNPKGVALVKRLVAISDAVIDNFTPRVMEKFGLGYEVLQEINPSVIVMRMPSYGLNGPWRDFPGYAMSFEMSAGLTQLTGYEGDEPIALAGPGDPFSGMHALTPLLAAMHYRKKTGKGQFIEFAQAEGLAGAMGQPIADYAMNGRIWERVGNRSKKMAPHNTYRSLGDDCWLAIAVDSDEAWKRFAEVIGNPAWTADPRFQTTAGRLEHRDELDRLVEGWSMQVDRYQAAALLQAANVMAGPVVKVAEVHDDPYLGKNGIHQYMERDYVGTVPYPKWPICIGGEHIPLPDLPPTLGQHNEYVLGTLLGMSKEEIAALARDQVIGYEMLGEGILTAV